MSYRFVPAAPNHYLKKNGKHDLIIGWTINEGLVGVSGGDAKPITIDNHVIEYVVEYMPDGKFHKTGRLD